MAIKIIEGIKYENNKPGRAFGGGIYGASATVGYSNTPTKITLNVVSEGGDYQIDNSFLNATKAGAKTLKFGNKSFSHMYLYKYNISSGPDSRVLAVDFIDYSIILDKTYVGLINRHSGGFYGDDEENGIFHYKALETKFSVTCWECDNTTVIPNKKRYFYPPNEKLGGCANSSTWTKTTSSFPADADPNATPPNFGASNGWHGSKSDDTWCVNYPSCTSAHGFEDGDPITFKKSESGTGPVEDEVYYVKKVDDKKFILCTDPDLKVTLEITDDVVKPILQQDELSVPVADLANWGGGNKLCINGVDSEGKGFFVQDNVRSTVAAISADGTITFPSNCDQVPGSLTIVLVNAEGQTISFIEGVDYSRDDDGNTFASNLATAIDSHADFSASAAGGTLTLTQTTAGVDGNTAISGSLLGTFTGSGPAQDITSVDFSGGEDDKIVIKAGEGFDDTASLYVCNGECEQEPPNPIVRVVAIAGGEDKTYYSQVDGVNGGYILLGRERFTETQCEVPKVEYKFSDLCDALDEILDGKHNLRDFDRNPNYSQNYVGTLREVLNNWGADFAFDFSFNGDRLVGVDLTSQFGLDKVRTVVNNWFQKGVGEDPAALIKSFDESHSLENTYAQSVIAKYIKPASSWDNSVKRDVMKTGKILSVFDAAGDEMLLGRPTGVFKKSVALAKYNPNARLMYLTAYAAQDGRDIYGNTFSGSFLSLGFFPTMEITDVQQKKELKNVTVLGKAGGRARDNHPIWDDNKDPNQDNYRLFVGIWNEQAQQAIENYDKEVADFYGKYGFFTEQLPKQINDCPSDWTPWNQEVHYYNYKVKTSTLPPSKVYSGTITHQGGGVSNASMPFSKILRANSGIFNLKPYNVFNVDENTWGTTPQAFEKAMQNPFIEQKIINDPDFSDNQYGEVIAHSDIDNYVPVYAYFRDETLLQNYMKPFIKDFDISIYNPQAAESGYYPGMVFAPNIEKCTGLDGLPILNVLPQDVPYNAAAASGNESRMLLTKNNVVLNKSRWERLRWLTKKTDKECEILCEENIPKTLCECDEYEEPFPAFIENTYDSEYFKVEHLANSVNVIFPVHSDYSGFFHADVYHKGTRGMIIDISGRPPESPDLSDQSAPDHFGKKAQGVLGTRIIDIDATPDIEGIEGENLSDPTDPANQFDRIIVDETGKSMSFGQYYQKLIQLEKNEVRNPSETFDIVIEGTEYSTLADLMVPENGLTSFAVNIGTEGITTNLSFASRPKTLPKKEAILPQVGPRLTEGMRRLGAPSSAPATI